MIARFIGVRAWRFGQAHSASKRARRGVQEGFCDTLVSVVLSLFWARDLHEVRDCNDRPSHDA